jgi:hypothetical protein
VQAIDSVTRGENLEQLAGAPSTMRLLSPLAGLAPGAARPTPKRALNQVLPATGPLLLVAAIVLLVLPLSRPYDVDVFLHAGHEVLSGLHVYPIPGSPAVYSGSSFVYPYFAVWPFVALAALPSALGTTIFFALSASAVIAACLIAAEGDPWPAVLVLCTAFAITGLQLGALSPLLFAGTIFLWRLRERPVAFALLAAPVLASKLFLVPLLAWLLLARRYCAFAVASAFTIALLAAGFVAGPLDPAQYLHLLSQLGAHEARSGFGLIGALMNAGVASAAAQPVAGALALALYSAAYVHNRRTRNERVLFCTGIVACLLVTPVVWSHYLVLLPAALLVMGAARRWLLVLALGSWALAPPHGAPDAGLIQLGAGCAFAASLLVLVYSAHLDRQRSNCARVASVDLV